MKRKKYVSPEVRKEAGPRESKESLLKRAANIYSKEHNITKLEKIAEELAFSDRVASKHIYKRCADLYERKKQFRNAARCYENAGDWSSARRLYLELRDETKATLMWEKIKREKIAEKRAARDKAGKN